MSATEESGKEKSESQRAKASPRIVRMKIAEIQNRPFGFCHEGKAYDTNPTAADIQVALDSGHLEARGIQSHRGELDYEWLMQSQGSIDEIARLQKLYNARGIAYLHVHGWDGFPLRVEANGVMHDGTHRLRAAIHRGMEDEVEVAIVE